ncbi:transglycosylase domain-containing protein [Mesorhizobium sp. B2-4-19]|uniref:transglycosylase domain-containing protein n=1 Tax=Mesorhizobium sp. B2-4-19 TaxID=2589930 RepID=UPI0015E3452E|nr:transglycosylase domain-containing protein [Mesorhizobium sp. B2-4-19]
MEQTKEQHNRFAKNRTPPQRSMIGRKLREIAVALTLEHRFSKDQTLEVHVNRVHFAEAPAESKPQHDDFSTNRRGRIAGRAPRSRRVFGHVAAGFLTKEMREQSLARATEHSTGLCGDRIFILAL